MTSAQYSAYVKHKKLDGRRLNECCLRGRSFGVDISMLSGVLRFNPRHR